LSIKNKIIAGVIALLVGVIGYQQVRLWFTALDVSPVASIYRSQPKPKVIAPEAPRKGEEVVSLPCVPLQVLDPVSSQPDASEGHYTIGRWDIPVAPRGGMAVVETNKVTGEPKLTFTPAALGIAELGKSRYATLWAEYALNSESEKKLSLKLEAEIDLFRLGPLWTRGRGGIYYSSTTLPTNENINDVGVYAGVGIGVGF